MEGQINKWFHIDELRCCKGHGDIPAPYIDEQLMDILFDIREFFGVPVTINDSYRTPEHNKAVGGVSDSYHLYDKPPHGAADIKVKGTRPQEVYDYINAKYPGTLGLGIYNTFVHLDTRNSKARWDG